MKRARIGLSLSGTTLSAIAVRRGAVEWAARMECMGDDESIADAVAQLLAQCPDIGGARVVAALGVPYVSVKCLHGLERVARNELVFRAVQQNPDRFFMTDSRGAAISSVASASCAGDASPSDANNRSSSSRDAVLTFS